MENEQITAYITKYALTTGIYSAQGEVCYDINSEVFSERKNCGSLYYHGNEWHRTKEDAIMRAEEMLDRKIKSLEKQIAKLKKMTFVVK